MHIVELVKEFTFEAAHRLPNLPESHKCFNLHGHSYRVEVRVRGPVDPRVGWYVDFATIKTAWKPLFTLLDHKYLNEVRGLENPTAEMIAVWVFERVKIDLPGLVEVVVHETPTSRAVYRGERTGDLS